MGKKDKHRRNSGLERSSKGLDLRTGGIQRERNLVFGLQLLDRGQGQSYAEWEEETILAKALDTMQGLCSMSLVEAINCGRLTIYDENMPPGTKYKRPNHVPDGIEWASIRVQGKVRVIGFVQDGFIFQIVFLDMDHEFYPSEKKHT